MSAVRFVGGLLALCALPASAGAQPTSGERDAEQDLRCGAWAAIVTGINQDDPEASQALAMGLVWFLGRYEGATGETFEEGLPIDYLAAIQPADVQAMQQECLPRLQRMGERLSQWGEALQSAGRIGESQAE